MDEVEAKQMVDEAMTKAQILFCNTCAIRHAQIDKMGDLSQQVIDLDDLRRELQRQLRALLDEIECCPAVQFHHAWHDEGGDVA